MQFDDAGALIAPVRWYFTVPGAKPLPFQHLYTSQNWLPVPRQAVGPGERWDSVRTYDKGKPPSGATGQRFCGTADQWQNGVASDAQRLTLTPSLLGTCCNAAHSGGVFVGGGKVDECQPSVSGQPIFAATSLHPGFIPGLEQQFEFWGFNFNDGTPSVYAANSFGGGPSSSACLIWTAAVTTNVPFRPAFRMSYDPVTNTSVWVVPPALPSSTLDNLIIYIQIRHKLVTGTGGVRVGGSSYVNPIRKSGSGGVLVGGSNASQLRGQFSGGVKAGGSSEAPFHYTGNGGVKAGGSSQLRFSYSGNGGVKAGASTTVVRTGVIVQCCPGLVIALTLTVTRSGHTGTVTWNSAMNGWHGTDPVTGLGMTLQCNLVGSTWTWQTIFGGLHCAPGYTQIAKSCTHPFTCTTQTVLVSSGGICATPGTFVWSYTE